MVEQEHSRSPTVFPESLISDKNSQTHTSNEWIVNEAISLIKSDELCNSDLLHMLYNNGLSSNKIVYSPLSNESVTEKDNLSQEILPKSVFSMDDTAHCDLYDIYCSDQNMSNTKDYFNPFGPNNISALFEPYPEVNSPLLFWGSSPSDAETLKMDDIFQVDKDDLVQSPTLAELNANDESLFDSFDTFEIPLPEQKLAKSTLLASGLNSSSSAYKLPSLTEASQIKTEPSCDRANLLLHMDTCEKEIVSENQMRSGFNPTEIKIEPLSPNTHDNSAEKLNVASQIMTKVGKKTHSFSETNVETSDYKHENISELSLPSTHEALDSEEDDSEMDYDYSSDVDEESEEETRVHSSKHTTANSLLLQKKKSRYFWQYNIQSKGPKAPKVKLSGKPVVSDNFSGVSDPVFNSSNLIKGIKHAGKARRGDGNDLTPNPQKLYTIGLELEKLNSVIEGLVPANELPINARSKSRKEKNKLASRACRLKKKAQHEANKLKLFGLQREQKHLLSVIHEVKKVIKKNIEKSKHGKIQSNVHGKVEALCMKKCYTQVAGCSAEFVNNVLKNVDQGDRTGGLDIEDKDE